jgi:hypothetical protein
MIAVLGNFEVLKIVLTIVNCAWKESLQMKAVRLHVWDVHGVNFKIFKEL